ncbi:MAG: zinc metallopeptidase [Caldicoprobacterales bacterium]|jgi:Zn-dependent membrane protease YugP|nr:zinc metallopeptidase [Clostridiales bacterium]
MPFLFYDSTMLILLPALILSFYAQYKVQSTFNRYISIANYGGYTGAEVAKKILDAMGLGDIPIDRIGGYLSDHYDPRKKVLRLSDAVYNGRSIAAIGVAAHEAGHAIQHANGYVPLSIRNAIVPIANFGSQAAFLFIFLGLIMGAMTMLDIGIYLFLAVVAFQLITLPVEFNASSRAVELLSVQGFVTRDEEKSVKKVLNAAALTYVAAAASAVAQLLRLLLLRDRRRR